MLFSVLPPGGPNIALRPTAMMNIAIFDAVNAIEDAYTPYRAHVRASHGASPEAAAAQAAHDVLTALFPTEQATFDPLLASPTRGRVARPGPAGHRHRARGRAGDHRVAAERWLAVAADHRAGPDLCAAAFSWVLAADTTGVQLRHLHLHAECGSIRDSDQHPIPAAAATGAHQPALRHGFQRDESPGLGDERRAHA